MGGMYLHIPFCKQACFYCDFHFSTVLKGKSEMVKAICDEIELRKEFMKGPLETVYFGGGTPSLLQSEELELIFNTIYKHYSVLTEAEITLEANPDDLTKDRLATLKNSPINRLSIGIQSFHEPHLQFMNRAHNAEEAVQCISLAKEFGFEHLNLDLIFGIPAANDHEGDEILYHDLNRLFELQPDHISAYALTIEDKTAFGKWTQSGKMPEIEEDYTAHQFEIVMKAMKENGYEQYEISNFCRDGKYSKHNTSYWQGKSYLGIGPSAHSYSGHSNRKFRSFNVANNAQYISAIEQKMPDQTFEFLSREDQINDYILTRLRTRWGIDRHYLLKEFQYDIRPEIQDFADDGFVKFRESTGVYTLTERGKLIADFISGSLFV